MGGAGDDRAHADNRIDSGIGTELRKYQIANQSEQNHNENTMNIFESRSDECILAMRDSVRYLDEKRVQLRKTSSTARKIIIGQIAQTKDKIITINKEFQTLLDEMMSPSIHATV